MKLLKYAALAAMVLCATTANAATYGLTIQKKMFSPGAWDITSIRVKGGDVNGLPKGIEPRDFTVQVTMPQGQCVANVTIFLGALRTDMHNVNICDEPTLILGVR